MPKIHVSKIGLTRKTGLKKILKILVVLSVFLFLGTAGVFGYFAKDLPDPQKLATYKMAESTKIYDRTGEVLLYDIHGEEKRTVVGLDQISPHLKQAAIVAEDDEFYQHFGVDFSAILRATGNNILVWSGLKKGPRVSIEGGSTITQQVIKNTLLSRERTISRKIKEWILAVELEMRYPKDKILEFYFNLVPYGSNAYGAEAAANTFFKERASELSLAEAALLASLPKAPTYYSPYGSHPEELKARQEYILKRMKNLNYISEEEYGQALEEKIEFAPNIIPIKAPHFVLYTKEYLEQKYGTEFVEKGGLKVITTLDWGKQKLAEEIVMERAAFNSKNHKAYNSAMVVLDPKTGQVLAMVGSKDYFGEPWPKGCQPGRNCLFDPNVNVVIRPRQPGSSFKPVVYARAFEKGFGPKTIVFDLETEFNPGCLADAKQENDLYGLDCYHPQNYDGNFRGPVTLKEALAQSLNVPSVKVLYLAGIEESIDLAHKLGITTLNEPARYGLALVLGGGEIKLLDETSAFSVFASDGIKNPPASILKITDEKGKVLEEFQPGPERVLEENIARQINDILSDNEARSPIFGERSSLYFEDKKVAVKTGTTQEYRDAWTIGYTPSIVVGVWVGNNNNTPMQKGPGAMVAAPIWRKFMEEMLRELPEEEFSQPEETATSPKPMLSGQLENILNYRIDKISGKLATDLTPQHLIIEKTYLEIHEILHYIDKDNPLTAAPLTPEEDPQYKNWEMPVWDWIRINRPELLSQETPPKNYDDLHVEENRPKVKIVFPEDGSIYRQGMAIPLQYSVSAPLGLKKVEYFLDDRFLEFFYPPQRKEKVDLAFNLQLPVIFQEEKNHLLTVVAWDEVENQGMDQIEIIIE